MTTSPGKDTPASFEQNPPLWWKGSIWAPITPTSIDHTRNTRSRHAATSQNTTPQVQAPHEVLYGAPVATHGKPSYPGGPASSPASAPGLHPTQRSHSHRLDRFIAAVAIIATAAAIFTFSLSNSKSELASPAREDEFLEIDSLPPRRSFAAATLEDAETLAMMYRAEMDQHHSYLTAGQEIARIFGAELTWGDYSNPYLCQGRRHDRLDDEAEEVVAWYCELEPYIIRLNRESLSMPYHLYEPGFIDTVKHELAHHIFDLRCETSEPPIAGKMTEGVTSSYAVLFLGANRDELDLSGYWDPAYFTSDETDRIAQAIRDGECGLGRI